MPRHALQPPSCRIRSVTSLALLVSLGMLPASPVMAQSEAPAAMELPAPDPDAKPAWSAGEPLPEPKGPAEIAGRVGGRIGPMALAGDGRHGYLGMGNGFLVLDLETPDRPLARIDLEAEWVAGLATFEGALYVAIWPPFCCPRDTYGSLLVYDLANPTAPRYVDRRGLHRSSGPIAIDRASRRAYVANLAFDLQDPLAPRDLGLAHTAPRSDAPTVIVGGLGYLASTIEEGWTQISVSDMAELPSQKVLATLAVDGRVRALAVQGKLLAAAAEGVLHILDHSQPDRLVQIGRAILPLGVRDVAIAGQSLLVATEDGTVRFAIRDPSRPREIAEWTSAAPGRASIGIDQLLPQGDHVWLVAPRAGLLQLRPQAEGQADVVSMPLSTLFGGRRMAVSGSTALVLQGDTSPNDYFVESTPPASALALIDIGDPAWPRVTAHLDRLGQVADVVAWGEHFFLARGLGGVDALRLDADGGLRMAADLVDPASRLAVDPDVGRLFLGFASGSGLHLAAYDLVDPAGPVLLARHLVPALHSDLRLHASGGRLYLGTERGLSVFRLDGDRFVLETHLDLPEGVRDIQASGRKVYATGGSRLHSLYRSRSLGLQLLGSAELHDRDHALDWFRSSVAGPILLRDGQAWVGDEAGTNAKGRLHRIDLGDDWEPRALGAGLGRPGRVHDLALVGEHLWVLDETAGLMSVPLEVAGAR